MHTEGRESRARASKASRRRIPPLSGAPDARPALGQCEAGGSREGVPLTRAQPRRRERARRAASALATRPLTRARSAEQEAERAGPDPA